MSTVADLGCWVSRCPARGSLTRSTRTREAREAWRRSFETTGQHGKRERQPGGKHRAEWPNVQARSGAGPGRHALILPRSLLRPPGRPRSGRRRFHASPSDYEVTTLSDVSRPRLEA